MKSKINITYRDKNGDIITDPVEGDKSYSPETKQLYIYQNDRWEMINPKGELQFTTYDLNKQLIAQLENLENNEKAMLEGKQIIQSFGKNKNNSYFMLLCRDINYYTIFHSEYNPMVWDDLNLFAEEVIDCVHDIGAIKSIEDTLDGAIEIWAQPIEGEPVAMYLFPYDQGVIECRI